MTRPRFLAIAGRLDDLGRSACGVQDVLLPGLSQHALSSDLTIFTSPGTPILDLPEGCGFIIGRLFARNAREAVERIDPDLAADIAASRGQVLIDRYWGDYVALGMVGGEAWALRDPSGALPLYRAEGRTRLVLFSDLAEPVRADLVKPRLDDQFTTQWLAFPALRTSRTGIETIAEILPGTRVVFSSGSVREEAAWTPWRFASRRAALSDFEDARSRVRREVARVVPALSVGHDPLLLELSGGLDSALIAAALGNAGRPFTAANFATRAPDGDERHYARAIADHVGAPLTVLYESDTEIDLRVPATLRLRPSFSPVVQPLHRAFAAHADEIGAGAFLTGTGGDNVFCYLTTAAPILDAFWSGHPWHAITSTLADVATQCDTTIWTAARFAAARLMRRRRRGWKRNVDFLLPEAVPAQSDPHPWLDYERPALPGKREHVEALVRIQHFLDPANREADLPFIHPLMAQPIMELCLTIPSWMWVSGGYNRSVARAAFEDLLPPEVINRRTKGRLESMCGNWYVEGREKLREILLDGTLRRDRIVNGKALETYLERDGMPTDALYFRIFELAAVELWLAGWRQGRAG